MLHLKLRSILEDTNACFPALFDQTFLVQKTTDNTGHLIYLNIRDTPGKELRQNIRNYFSSAFSRELHDYIIHSVRILQDPWRVEVRVHRREMDTGDRRGKRRSLYHGR